MTQELMVRTYTPHERILFEKGIILCHGCHQELHVIHQHSGKPYCKRCWLDLPHAKRRKEGEDMT